MAEVAIVQRRMTGYRLPLFEQMRERLARRGIRLRVLHGDPTPEEARKRDGGELPWAERCATRYLAGGRLCWQDFGALTRACELVIVTQENKLAYNLVSMTLERPRRLAFWGHGRNLQSDSPEGLRERFKRWTTTRVDWWFAYTGLSRELVRAEGFPEERITVLDNAVDTAELRRLHAAITAADRERVRRELAPGAGPVGVFVGSLYADKRLGFLVEAALRLRARFPGFTLLVAGDGPDRGLVEAAARAHPWIRVLGPRHARDKMELLAVSDVMLNPGLVGLGLLDAFVAGLPLVTTDCRLHSPEIAYLESGRNGLMTPDRLDAYVDGVAALLAQPQRAEALRAGARASAARYTIENMSQRFCEGIERCLKELRR
ncbi:glycosyltransferase family 4 protein [Caldimonas tepidiphila]|uniref:glycosyltransferase family 4 protein n=1 Tax=Caldimonas tepidiphila TaxID=2315841 RepID=UPI000E5BE74B|nr:glycosyltransferase family 4 protein [Caldimonas tepidiphila]